MNPGLYIHIPFCEQRCYYCAFTVAVGPDSAFEPYTRRLLAEIELAGVCDAPATIYFGGGTPSLLPATLLGRIRRCIPPGVQEITVEANPGTLSFEKLQLYREIGISRISLGAQSLEDEDLIRAGRLHRAKAVYADFEMLRTAGFDNINLDLIAGLPQQRFETWQSNLNRAIALRPEHISIYMLDHEERSTWAKLPPGIPEESDYAQFYTEAEALLDDAGYGHYEISNWALPGRECRHNLGYWSGVPYRGFGVGAHSFDGLRRFWNTASLQEYAQRLDAGQLPLAGEETLTAPIQLEEAFMLGLRQAAGIDVSAVGERFGIEFSEQWRIRVDQLQEAGWLQFDGRLLRLTQAGRLAATSVIGELLWPGPDSAKPLS